MPEVYRRLTKILLGNAAEQALMQKHPDLLVVDRELHNVTSNIGAIDDLLGQFNDGALTDEAFAAQARLLIEQGTPPQSEVQTRCREVIESRFATYVPVPHHRQIRQFAGPITVGNDAAKRSQLAEIDGFQFEAFEKALLALGFFDRVKPLLKNLSGSGHQLGDVSDLKFSLDHPGFDVSFNVVNGSAPIGYEPAFEDLSHQFDLLKRHKFHLSQEEIDAAKQAGKSPLNLPDILALLTIDQLNAGLPSSLKQEINVLNAQMVDDTIPDANRIAMYARLKAIYDHNPPPASLADSLERMVNSLRIPDDHAAKCHDLHEVLAQWGRIDAVVPVYSSDDGVNAYLSRQVKEVDPLAFLIPSGGRSPHEVKSLGKNVGQFNESDHMLAMAQAEQVDQIFPWHYPDLAVDFSLPPFAPYDILAPDNTSIDTMTNAKHIALRLTALHEVVGRPLNVIVVTNSLHGPRSWADFRKQIPTEVASSIKVLEYTNPPHLSNMVTQRKMHGLSYMYGEFIKQLYMLATDP